MKTLQFRVLYREFLFRIVDLEMLARRGDVTQMLGQLGAILAGVSVLAGQEAVFLRPSRFTPEEFLNIQWGQEHGLIAATMLAVGLFAVLSWESAFPDRRDVLVLAPLPVMPRTMLFAKVAALGTALGLTVVALNFFSGLTWPWYFAPAGSSYDGFARTLAAYWITMVAAGAFTLLSVLAVQGLAAQLPRRHYLRLSGGLQILAFCVFLSIFFLQPSWAKPKLLSIPANQPVLAWLPTYWFFGLFHVLNGSTMRSPILAWLAERALIGLSVAVVGGCIAFLLSYFRTLRKIVEEPDIMPGVVRRGWTLQFGTPLETAFVLFSIRTLLRSRQHRVILAFYLGAGFALITLYMQYLVSSGRVMGAVLPPAASSLILLCAAIVGMRIVFAMPLELRANWIFRVAPVPEVMGCYSAIRRSLFVLSVVPALLVSALVFFVIWPTRDAANHLVALGLMGSMLVDLVARRFPKIPFTCSHLTGKTQGYQMVARGGLALLLIGLASHGEVYMLADRERTAEMLIGLAAMAVWVRWGIGPEEVPLRFEEQPSLAIVPLDLHRDGGPAIAD